MVNPVVYAYNILSSSASLTLWAQAFDPIFQACVPAQDLALYLPFANIGPVLCAAGTTQTGQSGYMQG